MVGSLSGAMEEVYAAKEVIRKWNQQNAEQSGDIFLPVEWTISSDELQRVDVVIGIIGNYIDNQSFIEKCLELEKSVLLFFCKFHDQKNTIKTELDEIDKFRTKVQNKCGCYSYEGATDFGRVSQTAINEIIK